MREQNPQDEALVVAGVGLTPVGEHWDRSLRHLALEAMSAAREDAGGLRPQALYVANMLAPTLSGQSHLGALLADFAGFQGIEAVTVEAAGASSGVALRQAYLALLSGQIDIAMVLGVEKTTEKPTHEVDAMLSTAADADFESVQGLTPTSQAALLMRRYQHEFNVPADGLSGFSLNAHTNAVSNPYAMYRRAISLERYQRAGMMSDPLNMFDAAPVADGAAAVILARESVLPTPALHVPVAVTGSAVATAPIALHDQADPLHLTAAELSVQGALAQAGLPLQAIDLFELHDRFTILSALSLEASGFVPRGEGWKWGQDGKIGLQGEIPINTFGGSKARGDTIAATGMYQIAEVALQLQGRAGENQVPSPQHGMAQCLAGIGGTAATHILSRLAPS